MLGAHHSAIKEKIWCGKYVDVFCLLFRNRELMPCTGCGSVVCELEKFKHPRGTGMCGFNIRNEAIKSPLR